MGLLDRRRGVIPRRRLVFAIIAVILLATVASVAVATRMAPRPLTWSALLNASYPTSLVRGGAQLRNGVYDVEAAPGSASRIIVRLADMAAFGDVDGDGDADGAAILTGSGGGTGTFVELAYVRDDDGAARPLATTLLGDRILVREVRITDHRIVVRLRARGATDPLTRLTREVTRRFELRGDVLALVDETESEVPSTPAEDFVYQPQRIDLAAGGTRDPSGSLAPGRIAAYVVAGHAGEVLDLELRSEFDNAVVSVLGLTDATTYLSRREYAVRRSVQLPSDQDYGIKVVSLAGYDLPYTLHLALHPRSAATSTPAPTESPLPSRTPAPSTAPAGVRDSAIEALSSPAAAFARSRPPIIGAAVYLPSRGVVYGENADEQVPTASIVKVLVMLVVLEQARQDHRPASDDELALLWPMITESDNDATSELWERIGRGQAVAAYLRAVGVGGITPDGGTSWGVTFASARGMAIVLGKLASGALLDAAGSALAVYMLESVIPAQRWGMTAGTAADSGDRVGVKNGWYPGSEGWRVNSVGIVMPRDGSPYAVAIVTDSRPSWDEGIATIEGIAKLLNEGIKASP
ncbi:MAG TPA: serine hydrolase [Candidatus Limnocylindria bacterium]